MNIILHDFINALKKGYEDIYALVLLTNELELEIEDAKKYNNESPLERNKLYVKFHDDCLAYIVVATDNKYKEGKILYFEIFGGNIEKNNISIETLAKYKFKIFKILNDENVSFTDHQTNLNVFADSIKNINFGPLNKIFLASSLSVNEEFWFLHYMKTLSKKNYQKSNYKQFILHLAELAYDLLFNEQGLIKDEILEIFKNALYVEIDNLNGFMEEEKNIEFTKNIKKQLIRATVTWFVEFDPLNTNKKFVLINEEFCRHIDKLLSSDKQYLANSKQRLELLANQLYVSGLFSSDMLTPYLESKSLLESDLLHVVDDKNIETKIESLELDTLKPNNIFSNNEISFGCLQADFRRDLLFNGSKLSENIVESKENFIKHVTSICGNKDLATGMISAYTQNIQAFLIEHLKQSTASCGFTPKGEHCERKINYIILKNKISAELIYYHTIPFNNLRNIFDEIDQRKVDGPFLFHFNLTRQENNQDFPYKWEMTNLITPNKTVAEFIKTGKSDELLEKYFSEGQNIPTPKTSIYDGFEMDLETTSVVPDIKWLRKQNKKSPILFKKEKPTEFHFYDNHAHTITKLNNTELEKIPFETFKKIYLSSSQNSAIYNDVIQHYTPPLQEKIIDENLSIFANVFRDELRIATQTFDEPSVAAEAFIDTYFYDSSYDVINGEFTAKNKSEYEKNKYLNHMPTRIAAFFGWPIRLSPNTVSSTQLIQNLFGWQENKNSARQEFNLLKSLYVFLYHVLIKIPLTTVINVIALVTEFIPHYLVKKIDAQINKSQTNLGKNLLRFLSLPFRLWRFVGRAITSPLQAVRFAYKNGLELRGRDKEKMNALDYVFAYIQVGLSIAVTTAAYSALFIFTLPLLTTLSIESIATTAAIIHGHALSLKILVTAAALVITTPIAAGIKYLQNRIKTIWQLSGENFSSITAEQALTISRKNSTQKLVIENIGFKPAIKTEEALSQNSSIETLKIDEKTEVAFEENDILYRSLEDSTRSPF